MFSCSYQSFPSFALHTQQCIHSPAHRAMLCELYKRKLDIYFLIFSDNYSNCIRSYKCSQPKPVWDSSHSRATLSNSPEPGQQLQLWPNHLEAPVFPPAPPSSAGNTIRRVTCTEREPRLSKRPLFYSHFPSSILSFNFLYFILYGIMITEKVHEPAQGYHPLIKTRTTQGC